MASRIIGDKELRRKLKRLSDLRFLRGTMKAIGVEVSGVMKEYRPPPKPTYDRTGTLRKGWASRVASSGTSVTIGNKVPYAPWVQDPVLQAWMHVGRWQTTEDAVNEKEEEALKDIQKAVDRELAKG